MKDSIEIITVDMVGTPIYKQCSIPEAVREIMSYGGTSNAWRAYGVYIGDGDFTKAVCKDGQIIMGHRALRENLEVLVKALSAPTALRAYLNVFISAKIEDPVERTESDEELEAAVQKILAAKEEP